MMITIPPLEASHSSLAYKPFINNILLQIAASPLNCVITGDINEAAFIANAILTHDALAPVKTLFLPAIETIPLSAQQELVNNAKEVRIIATSKYDLHFALRTECLNGALFELLNILVVKIASTALPHRSQTFTQTVLVNPTHLSEEKICLKTLLQEIEESYIQQALTETNGVVSLAAAKLGLRRTTLIEKMKKRSKTL